MFLSSGVATQIPQRGQIPGKESLRKAKVLGGPPWTRKVGPEDRKKQYDPTPRKQGGANGVRHKSKGMVT